MRLLLLTALALAACGRMPTGPIFPGEPAPDVHPREFERWLDDKDRAEMIRPAPAGWRPRVKGAAAELRLTIPKTTIRLGEALPYRLEFKNVGSETVRIAQAASLFKGDTSNSDEVFKIWIDSPAGGRRENTVPFHPDRCAEEYPPKEAGALDGRARRRRMNLSQSRLNVAVRPGETLISRPWIDDASFDSCADAWRAKELNRPAQDGYRHLRAGNFKTTGGYRIHFIYADPLDRVGDPKLAKSYPGWEDADARILASNVVEIAVEP